MAVDGILLGDHSTGSPSKLVIADASAMIDRAIQQVRSISHLLHPPLLDEVGLLSALRWFLEGLTKRSGIETFLDCAAPAFPSLYLNWKRQSSRSSRSFDRRVGLIWCLRVTPPIRAPEWAKQIGESLLDDTEDCRFQFSTSLGKREGCTSRKVSMHCACETSRNNAGQKAGQISSSKGG